MKFTPRARKAFGLAEAEARRLGHPCLGSQHLVLGLFLLGSGVHFSVLRRLGFKVESLRQHIVAIGLVSEPTQTVSGFTLGISGARVLERAAQQAAAMAHTYTGTEHVLLGLISEESGGAANLLALQEADVAKARRAILDEYAQP